MINSNNNGYLYIIINQSFEENDVKIGSTRDYEKRYFGYKTYSKYPYKYKRIYRINNNLCNCYELDDIIKKEFNRHRYHIEDGGIEHYNIINIDEITYFLDKININYDILNSIDESKFQQLSSIELKKFEYDEEVLREQKIRKDITDKYTKKLYDHQYNAVDKWNLNTGILSHATGLGKTITAYGMISKYLSTFPDHIIIWHTKLKDIIKSQEMKIEEYIGNILPSNLRYKIYLNDINFDEINNQNLIICNSAKLKKVLDIVKPNLIITDECHDITADGIYELLIAQKKAGVTHLGLSATPIKEIKKSYKNINELYNNNLIDTITLLEGIDRELLVPFDMNWITIDSETSLTYTNTREHFDSIVDYCLDDVIKIIKKSKTKKILCWTRTKKNTELWEGKLQECRLQDKISDLDLYVSNSDNDTKCNKLQKFIKSDKGLLICVNRFRQGTDDDTIDTGIYMDFVDNRASHVSMQMIGRLLRLCKTKDKKRAYFYDLCVQDKENKKEAKLMESIIKYCDKIDTDYLNYKFEISKDNNSIAIKSTQTGKTLISCGINIEDIEKKKEFYKKTIEYLSRHYKYKVSKFTLKDLVSMLDNNNVRNQHDYYKYLDDNKHVDLPYFIQKYYPEFKWELVNTNTFYEKDEYITKIRNIYKENKKHFDCKSNHKLILTKLCRIDSKIPNEIPWEYYNNCNKNELSFIFNVT